MAQARILLIGAHGHGLSHLRTIRRLEAAKAAELVGICDTREPQGETAQLASGVPCGPDAAALLDQLAPDIVVIATPIQTHHPLAIAALRAGADILLEKPPVPQTSDFLELKKALDDTGRACQIGFQSFGSQAVDRLHELMSAGDLGEIRGIGVVGAWVRTAAYWERSRWAGRRTLDGVPVVDGAVTNPFAHATATALRIDGSDRLGDLASVQAELFHATPVEADDTSSLRIVTRRGTTIAVGLTLCARENSEPYVVVHCARGSARLWYTRDEMLVSTAAGQSREHYGRAELLPDLIAFRRGDCAELIAPLERTGAFTEVVETVRRTEPVAIPPNAYDVLGDGAEQRRVVHGVEEAVERVGAQLRLFSEQGLDWATP